MTNFNSIPMMFRAQIEGRCQLQRLPQARDDAFRWADEWVEGCDRDVPQFGPRVRTVECRISWRFVTNSGQDDSVIRPAIGAGGHPYYPGASMKGAFARCCTPAEALRYCGGEEKGEIKPGILRFHGGYPKDNSWRKRQLVDIIHPQEEWQVKNQKDHRAFVQMSLYQPTLTFGFSSRKPLEESEWEHIFKIWDRALQQGIGSRVSAGYGQPRTHTENSLVKAFLKGEGLASQLIDQTGEFRPNLFKAALRGHTLRLLGGVTDEKTAELLTKKLWGGFRGKNGAIVGELGISFNAAIADLDVYSEGSPPYDLPVYELKQGRLDILLMKDCSDKRKKSLRSFAIQLLKFSMLLGGFGKSWRRVDHRKFFPDYLKKGDKAIIGCHWEWYGQAEKLYIPVRDITEITVFLNKIHGKAKDWVTRNKETLKAAGSDWREAWHPRRVQVWGRIADNRFESDAVYWFHQDYCPGQSIKQSALTGNIGKIGRIWHRMYPHYTIENGELVKTKGFVELLTIFRDDSDTTQDFLDFLDSSKSDFQLLWGE